MEFVEGEDYLYPADALSFLEAGEQFAYGRAEGYFTGMIQTIEDVDPDAFQELETLILKAQTLADTAYADLTAGAYTQTEEYSGYFGDGRQQFRLNRYQTLEQSMNETYAAFAQWLAGWEL